MYDIPRFVVVPLEGVEGLERANSCVHEGGVHLFEGLHIHNPGSVLGAYYFVEVRVDGCDLPEHVVLNLVDEILVSVVLLECFDAGVETLEVLGEDSVPPQPFDEFEERDEQVEACVEASLPVADSWNGPFQGVLGQNESVQDIFGFGYGECT